MINKLRIFSRQEIKEFALDRDLIFLFEFFQFINKFFTDFDWDPGEARP